MSNDEGAAPASAPPAGAPTEGQPRPQFLINAQYVRDLSFENPNAPQSLIRTDGNPDVKLNVDVQAKTLGSNRYEVVLVIHAAAKRGEETTFMVELDYAALITAENIPANQMEPLLLVEAPRMLFPFAREIIATTSRDGGFPPLMMQPVDFVAMYRAHKTRQTASPPAAAAGDSDDGGVPPTPAGG
ncbi:MAG: protein-export chaperone SecB [Alphaproteobacteria bacterium]